MESFYKLRELATMLVGSVIKWQPGVSHHALDLDLILLHYQTQIYMAGIVHWLLMINDSAQALLIPHIHSFSYSVVRRWRQKTLRWPTAIFWTGSKLDQKRSTCTSSLFFFCLISTHLYPYVKRSSPELNTCPDSLISVMAQPGHLCWVNREGVANFFLVYL